VANDIALDHAKITPQQNAASTLSFQLWPADSENFQEFGSGAPHREAPALVRYSIIQFLIIRIGIKERRGFFGFPLLLAAARWQRSAYHPNASRNSSKAEFFSALDATSTNEWRDVHNVFG
jgi:hypothetical protein